MTQPPKDPKKPENTNSSAEKIARDVVQGVGDVVQGVEDVVGHAAGAVGGAVNAVGNAAGSAAGAVERILRAPIRLPGLGHSHGHSHRRPAPGAAPGIEATHDIATPPPKDAVHFAQLSYGKSAVVATPIEDVTQAIGAEMPEGCTVRWINVDGLHPHVVDQMRRHFGFHSLAAEDVLHVPQRPKVESYDDHLFVVVRMLQVKNGELRAEQVSLFMIDNTILTFQETQGDCWEPIRARIKLPESRFHSHDIGYLVYALLDATVDHCFPILEQYGDTLESLEQVVLKTPTPQVLGQIHAIKRDLSLLRRVMWPMRDAIDVIFRDEDERFDPAVRTYMRNVYDHSVQIIDIIETYREMASGLTDLYMSAAGNRMNEIMKVLTIMSSFFIPITFVAGVYGMNFDKIPETHWEYGYLIFWCVCICMTIGLLIYFKRKGWLSSSDE